VILSYLNTELVHLFCSGVKYQNISRIKTRNNDERVASNRQAIRRPTTRFKCAGVCLFNAIIADKILYALPVYYGYLTQGHKEMLQRIFNRGGFTVREYDLEALAENAQYDSFHNSCSTGHCLNHLYTANRKPAGSMQLRHRGHEFTLPTIHLEFNKRHFVARVLFDYVWCVSHVCFIRLPWAYF